MVIVTACDFMNMRRSRLSHSQATVYEKTNVMLRVHQVPFFFFLSNTQRSVHEQAS